MKPRRHRARGRAAIVVPEKDKKGKFGAIFLVLGLRRGWGGVQGLPTGVRAGDKISEACTCRSARPRAAAPLQKFCAALIWHWRHDRSPARALILSRTPKSGIAQYASGITLEKVDYSLLIDLAAEGRGP